MSELMGMGVALMGYGLAGVFVVLALFILLIKLITKAFPAPGGEEAPGNLGEGGK